MKNLTTYIKQNLASIIIWIFTVAAFFVQNAYVLGKYSAELRAEQDKQNTVLSAHDKDIESLKTAEVAKLTALVSLQEQVKDLQRQGTINIDQHKDIAAKIDAIYTRLLDMSK